MKKNLYEFSAISLQGKEISMKDYEGKVILVVNTASKCGLTSQYEGLEEIYQKYKDQGFVVLGFPCNQFKDQEPGSNRDIAQGCILNYGVTFPMFEKIEVNGDHTHPLYQFLKQELRGIFGSKIKWNFTKFLINRNGKPVRRFAPIRKPRNLGNSIEKLL